MPHYDCAMIYKSMKNVKLILWNIFVSGSLVPLNEKENRHIYKVYVTLAAYAITENGDTKSVCKRASQSAGNSIRGSFLDGPEKSSHPGRKP